MLQNAFEGFGRLWESFWRLWNILGCFERFWDALAAKVKIFKALDALEGDKGFRSALGGFGNH